MKKQELSLQDSQVLDKIAKRGHDRWFKMVQANEKLRRQKGITLEWLENKCEELGRQFDNDKYNQYNYERGFDYLLEAARKEASK